LYLFASLTFINIVNFFRMNITHHSVCIAYVRQDLTATIRLYLEISIKCMLSVATSQCHSKRAFKIEGLSVDCGSSRDWTYGPT